MPCRLGVRYGTHGLRSLAGAVDDAVVIGFSVRNIGILVRPVDSHGTNLIKACVGAFLATVDIEAACTRCRSFQLRFVKHPGVRQGADSGQGLLNRGKILVRQVGRIGARKRQASIIRNLQADVIRYPSWCEISCDVRGREGYSSALLIGKTVDV